jgi:hypothetical protein
VSTGRNPTFDRTSIQFSLPDARRVQVRVFDAAGRLVDTLADADFDAGDHALAWSAENRASGAYFFRVTAGADVETGRILVLR